MLDFLSSYFTQSSFKSLYWVLIFCWVLLLLLFFFDMKIQNNTIKNKFNQDVLNLQTVIDSDLSKEEKNDIVNKLNVQCKKYKLNNCLFFDKARYFINYELEVWDYVFEMPKSLDSEISKSAEFYLMQSNLHRELY